MPNDSGQFDYTPKQKEILFGYIYTGKFNSKNLPNGLYIATANDLKGGLYTGYGGTPVTFKFGSPDFKLINELRTNIYHFSAAKTYQQVRELTDALYGDDDKLLSPSKFKQAANAIFDKYNGDINLDKTGYLGTERVTAIGQAQSASKWIDYQAAKEQYPYLQFHISDASVVCDICAPLDGIILPIDDPFWDIWYPLLHFNCNCYVTQVDKYSSIMISDPASIDVALGKMEGRVDDVFKMNSGKDGYIFSPKHPYFVVPKSDEKFKTQNFGLPIPTKD